MSSPVFLKRGNSFFVSSDTALDMHDKLPVGNYIIQKTPNGELYLEKIESFKPVAKLYGDTTKHTKRVINTFWDRANATGVMMTGEKGSGKTLLSKNICIELAKQDVPTIVINSPWCGDSFNNLIQSVNQPCIILFDEFEKVYDSEDQEKILTLLDGVFPSKKLFLITSNDKYRVDRHMRNRPGRIYYMFDFKGLDEQFIREYCADNMIKYPQYTDDICKIASLFGEFNFDMLSAFVQEIERYGEKPQELIDVLNCKPEFDTSATYNVAVYAITGEKMRLNYPDDLSNPLGKEFATGFWVDKKLYATNRNKISQIDVGAAIKTITTNHYLVAGFGGVGQYSNNQPTLDTIDVASSVSDDDDDDSYLDYSISVNNMVNIDSANESFVFKTPDNLFVLIATRQKKALFNYHAL